MYKTLWFIHSAHQKMMEIAAVASDGLEIGGYLYGYTDPDQGYVVVTHVYPMGPKGKRLHNWTIWDDEETRRLRRECWGNARWEVGDFHTHPETCARPSPGDESGQRKFREVCGWKDNWFPDVMVIISVPPGGKPEEVGAWFHTPTERIDLEIEVADPAWNPVDDNGNWIEATESAS